jgi:hypothetical protein
MGSMAGSFFFIKEQVIKKAKQGRDCPKAMQVDHVAPPEMMGHGRFDAVKKRS